jgi:SAM-dependent methyltransferase
MLTAARRLLRDHALSAPDTWERHLIVADLVGDARSVLDVGGLPGQLDAFLPRAKVLAANITDPADLIVDPSALPFRDGVFDATTSLDVLEHVPAPMRKGFVAEQLRVSGGRTVLCCPLGSPEHVAAEAEIHAWYRDLTGEDHPWLVEHAENGLPTLAELQEAFAVHDGPVRFAFHGDFREVDAQFRRIVLARHRHRPGDVLGFAAFRLPYRPRTQLSDTATPYANRVFVIADAARS